MNLVEKIIPKCCTDVHKEAKAFNNVAAELYNLGSSIVFTY